MKEIFKRRKRPVFFVNEPIEWDAGLYQIVTDRENLPIEMDGGHRGFIPVDSRTPLGFLPIFTSSKPRVNLHKRNFALGGNDHATKQLFTSAAICQAEKAAKRLKPYVSERDQLSKNKMLKKKTSKVLPI